MGAVVSKVVERGWRWGLEMAAGLSPVPAQVGVRGVIGTLLGAPAPHPDKMMNPSFRSCQCQVKVKVKVPSKAIRGCRWWSPEMTQY